MRFWNLILILILVTGALAGCGGDDAQSATEQGRSTQALEENAGSETYASAALDTAYEGALAASSQLALGTFKLEDTKDAVTAEQAKTLLPLWQAIQGGALQSEAETNAVLKQIEGTMQAEQLAAIATMQLTMEDLGIWMRERGVNPAPAPDAAAGDGSGGFAPPNRMNEEERAAMRATVQAGGGRPGSGPNGGDLSGAPGGADEEERAAMRATIETGGMTFGGGRAAASTTNAGQLAIMATQVVELLTARAAE